MTEVRTHGRLDARLERAGLRTVLARDTALAVVVAALTVAGLAALTGPLASELDVRLTPVQHALLLVVAAAQSVALAVRRVRPAACLVLVAVLQVLLSATVADQATVRGVAGLVAFYTAGTCLPLARLVGWGALALVVEVVGTPLVDLALPAALPAPAVRRDRPRDGHLGGVGRRRGAALRGGRGSGGRGRDPSGEHRAARGAGGGRGGGPGGRHPTGGRGRAAPGWPASCTTSPRTTSPG